MTTNSLLSRMTNQQLAALSTDHKRWLALQAGAGAGKTRVLATRVVLLLEAGELLESIVAITFTRKAARELASRVQTMMATRIRELVKSTDQESLTKLKHLQTAEEHFHRNRIGTIDSFCRVLLSRHALDADVEPGFGQLDEIRAARKRSDFLTSIARQWSDLATRHAELNEPQELAIAESWSFLNRWLSTRDVEKLLYLATIDRLNLADALATWNDFQSQSDRDLYLSSLKEAAEAALGEALSPEFRKEIADGRLDALELLKEHPSDEKALWFVALADAVEKGELDFEHCVMPSKGKTGKDFYQRLDGGAKRLTVIKNMLIKILDEGAIDPVIEKSCTDLLFHFARLRPLVVEAWEQSLGAFLTFDDLKTRLFRFVASDAGRDAVAQDIRWMMIDEFQDTDDLQWRLFARLLAADKANLFIVGDDKQSIYRFRGAEVAVFRNARDVVRQHNENAGSQYWPKHPADGSDLPEFEAALATKLSKDSTSGVLTLSANFRSLDHPLNHGNRVFENLFGLRNPSSEPVRALGAVDPEPSAMDCGRASEEARGEVMLLPMAEGESKSSSDDDSDGDSGPITYLLPDDNNEAHFLIDHIKQELVGKRGIQFSQIAILTRTQAQITLLAAALAEASLPFAVTGGRGLYQSQESSDFWALAAAIATPNDNFALTALLRSPLAAISDQSLTLLVRHGGAPKLTYSYDSLSKLLRKREQWPVTLELDQASALSAFATRFQSWVECVGTVPFPEVLQRALLECGAFGHDWSTGSRQRNANLREFVKIARVWHEEFGNDLAAFAEDMRASIDDGEQASVGQVDDSDSAIQIMTIHQSKGKEFDVVILPFLSRRENLDYGVFDYRPVGSSSGSDLAGRAMIGLRPGKWHKAHEDVKKIQRPLALRIIDSKNRLEARAEDRRLLYVAWTRAADHLSVIMRVPRSKKFDAKDIPTPESGGMRRDLCSALGIVPDACAFESEELDNTRARVRSYGFADGFTLEALAEPKAHSLGSAEATLERVAAINAFLGSPSPAHLALEEARMALAKPIVSSRQSPWSRVTEDVIDSTGPEKDAAKLVSRVFGVTRRDPNKLSPAERGTVVHALLESHVRKSKGHDFIFDVARVAQEMGVSSELLQEALPDLESEADRGAKLLWQDGRPAREFTEISLPHAADGEMRAPRLDYLAEVKPGHWRIVDFKTGEFHESYVEQVLGYARALAGRLDALGEKLLQVDGELLFTSSGELRKVGTWSKSDLALSDS